MKNIVRLHPISSASLPSGFYFLRRWLRLTPYPLVLIPFFALPAFAQQKWQRTYGGTGWDAGYSVQQTTDGGYIVAGNTTSFGHGAYDVYLIKTNVQGDPLWTRTYGGTGDDMGFSVQQTLDGGYIVAGMSRSFGNEYQVYLIKTNASGDALWSKTYGGTGTDCGCSVQQTSDGGYIVAGWGGPLGGHYQVCLIKTNASGDTLWTRTYGGTNEDWGYSVQQTSDGGYIVAGGTASFGNDRQVYLIKTNASGDTLWTRTYGGTIYDQGSSVRQTSEGGYIVAGETSSFGNNWYQVYLIKTNASGDTLWTRTYGGAGEDGASSVQQTTDGGFIVSGFTTPFGDSEKVYLIKTNASGDTLWTRTYGGPGYEFGSSVQQTSDGGYIVAGGTTSFGNDYQVYLIKTDADGNVGVEQQEGRRLKAEGSIKATPNPFTSYATIPGHGKENFDLYDVAGRKVGTFKGDRIGVGLAAGVYFLKGQASSSAPLRIIKVR